MATKKISALFGGLAKDSTKTAPPPAPDAVRAEEPPVTRDPIPGAIESICPCGQPVEGHRCRLCGAVKTVSSVSGNVIWMRNGRIAAAFQDSKRAYVEMAERWGVPKDRWPREFLDS